MQQIDDKKLLLGIIGASIVSYNAYFRIRDYFLSRRNPFVPVGIIKELYIYPVKSCRGQSVFSLFCAPKGAVVGETRDRHFQIINGDTGLFYTARQKPQMVLIEVKVDNNVLSLTLPTGNEVQINLEKVKTRKDNRRTTMFERLKMDGLDCGDEVSALLSEYLEEPNTRMVMYMDDLYTERTCVTEPQWWNNNEVPNRRDDAAYNDLAPYLIQSQSSLDELNKRLDEKVSQKNFRPIIVVDHCDAWDEDKWSELRIGDAELQCFRPCTRCTLPTIDPATGKKSSEMQPLKELRQFRLAPEGPMRKDFKDDPLFGVYAGVNSSAYIHVGQVVYARYKKCAF